MADTTQTSPQTGQNLERAREILLGPVMRDYENRFAALRRDVERLQQALERANRQLAEQESQTNRRLQELREELLKQDDELRAELREAVQNLVDSKVERQTLGDLFIELGTQIKGNGALANVLEELLSGES